MNSNEYLDIVKKNTPKEKRLKNTFIAALTGGIICILSEISVNIMISLQMKEDVAIGWTILVLIMLASLFTTLGFFDKWASILQMGIIIPITGFAHSISSAILDYKKDGLITGIGANAFKLAGSVILYGVVSAFIFAVGRMILFG